MIKKLKMLLLLFMVFAAFASAFSSVKVSAQTSWSVMSVDVADFTDDEYMQEKLMETFALKPDNFLDENGESMVFGGATDCLAYARWAFYQLFGMYDHVGANTSGFFHEYSTANNSIRKIETADDLRAEFDALDIKLGAMVCYFCNQGSNTDHSMIYLKSDDDGMYFLHGNWGGKCNVLISFFTWDEMMSYFGQPAEIKTPWDYPNDIAVPIYTNSVKLLGKGGVYVGAASKFTAVTAPDNASISGVYWSVNNISGEAEIDSEGNLTGIKPGLVTVTATARDGSGVYASKTIKIGAPNDVLNPTALTVKDGTAIVRWDKCEAANGYYVFCADSPSGRYDLVSTVTSGEVNTVSIPLRRGGDFFFKICTYSAGENGVNVGEKCSFISVDLDSAAEMESPVLQSETVPIIDGFLLNGINK